jgi:hypothetical protein
MLLIIYNLLNRIFSNNLYLKSSLYLFILSKLNTGEIPNIEENIFYNYIFSIFTLSLIGVLSLVSSLYLLFINYFISDKFEKTLVNYPRIITFLKYSMALNKIWILIDLLLVLFILSAILITSFLILDLSIKF